MGHSSKLQPFELHEKLHGNADDARGQKQHPGMSITKSWRVLPQNRQQSKRPENESVAAVFEDIHLGKSDLAEQKPSTPKAACSSQAHHWPDRTRSTVKLFPSLNFQLSTAICHHKCLAMRLKSLA